MDINCRDENIKLLETIISKKFAINIENSVFKFTNEYCESNNTPFLIEQIYNEKLNEIIIFLKNYNSKIINKFLEINSEKIAFLKEDELIPDKYSIIKQKIEINKNKNKNLVLMFLNVKNVKKKIVK